jgi:predicted ATPase/signal transduction histidine kinase/tRNA A-37 threonylcarbamoyl transferase component Bud32
MIDLERFSYSKIIYQSSTTTIYRAFDKTLKKNIIAKYLNIEYSSEKNALRHKQEYFLLKKLKGDGVPHAIEFINYQSSFCILMEDISGTSLDKYFEEMPQDFGLSLEIALKIIDALILVHENGIVHKDINLSNIVYNNETKELQLIDFGISTHTSTEYVTTRDASKIEGTLQYISPEQTGRINRVLDYRSDFYSLGVTLFKMLTGRFPFASDNPLDLIHKILVQKVTFPPEVPKSISLVITKLLEKIPEKRYQSLEGLKKDLEFILKNRDLHDFTPGTFDNTHRPMNFSKFYGREKEQKIIFDSFVQSFLERPIKSETILIAGAPGIGKTTLVYDSMSKQKKFLECLICNAKFDQLERKTPLSSFVKIFNSLIYDVLKRDKGCIEAFTEDLISILKENTGVLITLNQNVRLLFKNKEIGPQKIDNEVVLFTAIEYFIKIFVRRVGPIVIFLDDLQWADSASLKLFTTLSVAVPSGIILIGAYRNNKEDFSGLLSINLQDLEKKKKQEGLIHIKLNDFSLEEVQCYLAGILEFKGDELLNQDFLNFANLLKSKTAGNPFFLKKYLSELYNKGHVKFINNKFSWCFDLEQIQLMGATSNVVDFIVSVLDNFPTETKKILATSSMLGNKVKVLDLLQVTRISYENLIKILNPVIVQDLIIALNKKTILKSSIEVPIYANIKFTHDKIQQACYQLLTEEEKIETHYKIAKALLPHLKMFSANSHTLSLLEHYNNSITKITDYETKKDLIYANIKCVHFSMDNMAFDIALSFLEHIEKLGLDTITLQEKNDLLYLKAKLFRLLGRFKDGLEFSFKNLDSTNDLIQKYDYYLEIITNYTLLTNYEETMRFTFKILKEAGENLPDFDNDEEMANMIQEILLEPNRVLNENISKIRDLNINHDPLTSKVSEIYAKSLPVSVFHQKKDLLFPLLTTKGVLSNLKHGVTEGSIESFSLYSILLQVIKQYPLSKSWGENTIELFKKHNFKKNKCSIFHTILNHSFIYSHPLNEVRDKSLEILECGIITGDYMYTGYIHNHLMSQAFISSIFLSEVHDMIQKGYEWTHKTGNLISNDIILCGDLINNYVRFGKKHSSINKMTEEDLLKQVHEHKSFYALGVYYPLKAFVQYLEEDYEIGLETNILAHNNISFAVGEISYILHTFVDGLYLHYQLSKAFDDDLFKRFEDIVAQFKEWNNFCPTNFEEKYLVLLSLKDHLEGYKYEFLRKLNEAEKIATQKGIFYIVVLIGIIKNKMLSEGDNKKLIEKSVLYLKKWGGYYLAKKLSDKYLLTSAGTKKLRCKTMNTTTSLFDNTDLDFETLIKASQAISNELNTEMMIIKLLEYCLKNIGATAGSVYLIDQDGRYYRNLLIEYDKDQDSDDDLKIIYNKEKLNQDSPNFFSLAPISFINSVKRSKSPKIIDFLVEDQSIEDAEYIQKRGVKSLLGHPLMVSGEIEGIIVAENSLIEGAFNEQHLKLLLVLSSQMGISFKNVRLMEEKMSSLSVFTTGIAHEVKNPLHLIQNGASLIKKSFTKLAESIELEESKKEVTKKKLLRGIDIVQENCKRADLIINSLMNFVGKVQSNKKEYVQLSSIAQEVFRDHSLVNPWINFNIELEAHEDEEKHFFCKKAMVRDAFDHIVKNSVDVLKLKYQDGRNHQVITKNSKGPTIKFTVKNHDTESLSLEFFDNGYGISKKQQSNIFVPFYSTKKIGEGIGLGLYAAYKVIVEEYRGTIDINSEEGKFTKVKITLPLQ